MVTETQKMLKKFNEAFADGDHEYIINQVTDDIVWTMVGADVVKGKEQFAASIREMGESPPGEVRLGHIITHGKMAAVNGEVITKTEDGSARTYAFCDVMKLSGFKDAKISELTSYMIETTEK